MRVFASGLRNPVGLDWEPGTNALWTVVNERDRLGDQLVPGLPHQRAGRFLLRVAVLLLCDRMKNPGRKANGPIWWPWPSRRTLAVGSHRAPLGLVFYEGSSFPEQYRDGAFVGLHGSWNRSEFVGYKVVFIPFENGQPSGPMQDFLTGFISNEEASEVYGRPVGVAVMEDGSLLVADDGGNRIWRVSATETMSSSR